MLDIGGPELLVVAVITLIVVGPKDLPKVVRTVGRVMGKIRGMTNEFKLSLQELEDETEFRQMKRDLEDMARAEMDESRKYMRDHIPQIDDDPEAGFDDGHDLPPGHGDDAQAPRREAVKPSYPDLEAEMAEPQESAEVSTDDETAAAPPAKPAEKQEG